jgi:ketosteroid isomerase-like protein
MQRLAGIARPPREGRLFGGLTREEVAMAQAELEDAIEQYHQSVAAFVAGDPKPQKRMWSRGDDITLANPLGPPARGWDQVEATLDRAIAQLRKRPNQVIGVERISDYATHDLAYMVEIERDQMELDNGRLASVSLRVTTIFRREDGVWRIVHRHADTVTTPRSLESLVEQ